MSAHDRLVLRSLTIHRYEQFKDCAPVEFAPDMNLLLGSNGSGKTSLLRLLTAVLRFDYEALRDQEFHIKFVMTLESRSNQDVEIRGEVQNRRDQDEDRSRRQSQELAQVVDPMQSDLAAKLRSIIMARKRYALDARFTIQRGDDVAIECEMADGRIRLKGAMGPAQVGHTISNKYSVGAVLFRIWPEVMHGFQEPLQDSVKESVMRTVDEEIATLGAMRPLADHACMICETERDFEILTQELEYDASVVKVVDSPIFDLTFDMIPSSGVWAEFLLKVVSDTYSEETDPPSPEQVSRQPIIYEKQALESVLVLDALGADRLSVRLNLQKEWQQDGELNFEGRGVELRVRFRSGLEVVDSQLTFGQKRLLTIGLAAWIANPGSPMLVDEIDNGMHPDWVERALEFIGQERQSFIASHNQYVVDLRNYDSPEDIRRAIHICRRHDDGRQSWEPIDPDHARDIHEKIEIGILHPSQVLRNEGLW